MRKYFDDKFYKLLEHSSKERFLYFLHHTASDTIAQKIMKEGFRYYDSFYKTTDEIIKDDVYLNYWFQMRRAYGSVAVVITIAEDVLDKVNKYLRKENLNLVDNFAVLSNQLPEKFEDDYLYTLSNRYIRGYYDIHQNQIVLNPDFDAHFFSESFYKNIEFLKKLA